LTPDLRALDSEPGPGFCYSVESGFCHFASGFGPLLVAFDSNIVSYLEVHGRSIIDDEPAVDVSPPLRAELDALAQLLEVWRTRDIRFIVVPQIVRDFVRQPPVAVQEQRRESCRRIIEAISYQIIDDDVSETIDHLTEPVRPVADQLALEMDTPTLLLKPLDAQLVREAIACEVDVFLTNDKQLRSAVRRLRLPIHALSPVELMEKFARENVGLMGEDHLGHESCDAALSLLCDDIGKWGPLFEILEGESHG